MNPVIFFEGFAVNEIVLITSGLRYLLDATQEAELPRWLFIFYRQAAGNPVARFRGWPGQEGI